MVRGNKYTKVATRTTQWALVSGYLNYEDVLFVVIWNNIKFIIIWFYCTFSLFPDACLILFTMTTTLATCSTEKLMDNNGKCCFLHSPERLPMHNYFFLPNICLQWYEQTKLFTIIKNFKKNLYIYTLKQNVIIWSDDMMSQTLKYKQGKQILFILYHINWPSKHLLE